MKQNEKTTFHIFFFFVIMQLLQNCIGPTIRIGQEILCLPYVGFFSLSHFFNLFLNVTMIMNICLFWQFGGHNNHFPPDLPKTNSLEAPKGPQKVSKSPKPIKKNSCWLWQNLADSGWLWPILDDFWWLWLTLAAKVSQSQPESASMSRGWLTLANYGWHWLTVADCGWLWLTLAYSGWLQRTLAESQSQPESARVIKSHPELVRVSHSQPDYVRVTKSFK